MPERSAESSPWKQREFIQKAFILLSRSHIRLSGFCSVEGAAQHGASAAGRLICQNALVGLGIWPATTKAQSCWARACSGFLYVSGFFPGLVRSWAAAPLPTERLLPAARVFACCWSDSGTSRLTPGFHALFCARVQGQQCVCTVLCRVWIRAQCVGPRAGRNWAQPARAMSWEAGTPGSWE